MICISKTECSMNYSINYKVIKWQRINFMILMSMSYGMTRSLTYSLIVIYYGLSINSFTK